MFDETPYPDNDFTEREQWAETEARQFIKNAKALDECIHSWLTKPSHPDNYRMAMEIAIKAQGWRAAAEALRRPRIIRLEFNLERGY